MTRYVAYATDGAPRLGAWIGDEILDLGPDPGRLTDGLAPLANAPRHPTGEARLLAPLRAGKIVCVGRNYRDHVGEKGMAIPERPMLFAKLANAVIGPGQPIVRPPSTAELDLECELGVVIGRRARRTPPEQALDAVFGYTILNDVSARDHQRDDGQWLRAKSSDAFAPMGPCVVTRDELGDGSGLRITSSVNGETWQDSTTDQMIFNVAAIIAFVSANITLEPGDLVATGTPAGVGQHHDPPRFLQPGDVVRCEIEGIGVLENPVTAA